MDVKYCCSKCCNSDGSVLLVFQMGQPRIWMSMSFPGIHPKYKTPSYATVVTGFVVAIPALFLKSDYVY
jgi:amino acid transporter